MNKVNLSTLTTISCLILAASLTGCAATGSRRSAAPGDEVGVSFSCLLPRGEIAVSTSTQAGKNPGERLSPLFIARDSSAPVLISAGEPDPLSPTRIRPLEEDVLQQLRGVVVGMSPGESRSLLLHASRLPGGNPSGGVLKYNRNLHYSKVGLIPADAYREATGKDPALGDACTAFREPAFRGVVTEIQENVVHCGYTLVPGARVAKFFGAGAVSDAGNDFIVRIDAEEGTLVRNEMMVGKIVKVTSDTVQIDFGDQFGGEPLSCSLSVDSVAQGAPPRPGTPERDAHNAAGTP